MRMSCTQLACDINDMEGVYKRDYNELRRTCTALHRMNKDIHKRREEVERWEIVIIAKEAEVD